MTPERWQQVEQLLAGALQRGPAERAAFLDRECANDRELRAEVESLLTSETSSESFLKGNALADGAALLEDDEADSFIGGQLGNYLIEKRLGAGGMGEVYLARDVRLGRKVALKLLDPILTEDQQARSRFLREARLASSLDHPNICTIHEVGEENNRLFITMQFIEGETLRQVLDGRPLPFERLASISLQVADALSAAHAAGIIHRDIKPGNIMVTPSGKVKVLDFGLAKLLEQEEAVADTGLTMTGAVMGTPAAMSPEQARGEGVDHRSDIFSFGVVLYEMATGKAPFTGRSRADVISALLKERHTPAAELNTEIPLDLSRVIDRALAKEPPDRYQSMPELVADLRPALTEAGGLVQHPHPSETTHGASALVTDTRSRFIEGLGLRSPKQLAMVLIALAMLASLTFVLSRSWRKPQVVAPSALAPQPAITSIAVLPFKPLVAGTRDEALELGMADALIARLSNLRGINVRPISAVRKYMGLDQDAVAAGREQRVDAVLEGSIQKAGDRIRVTVRLVRVGNGEPIWADQFDNQMTDIFTVQDSISERVAVKLALRLSGEEEGLLTKRHTANPEAYRLYVLGRYHLNRWTDDGFRRALDYFQQAIETDPSYALAHAGLADAYNDLGSFDALPPKESYPKARQAAERALQLDEQLAEAHVSLASAKFFYDWDWTGAEEEFKRAIRLNPGYSDAHQLYSYCLVSLGRFDEALREMQQAVELDPASLPRITGVGEVLYLSRRYDEAIAAYQKTLEMDPNFGFAHWALGRVYIEKQMYPQAIAALLKSIPLSGDSPDEPATLACAYALSGKRAEARKIISDLESRRRSKYVAPTVIAFIYSALGENDQAFAWMSKALEERDTVLALLKVDPEFDTLRTDPRFTVLMKGVGLAQ